MPWLYSVIFAGMLFSGENNIPIYTNYGYTNSNAEKIIGMDETERFEQTYPLNPNGKVSVSNVNGSITIETWDNAEVKLEAVKTADTKDKLSEVEIKIDARPDSFSVETNYDNMKRDNKGWRNNGKLQVEYKLIVPRTAVLDEIETVNGSINISNAANSTKASAVNGQVRATNLRGAANLSTVNGTVEADFDQLQSGSRISLNTVNGQVNLLIPSDADATVKADTLNGSISNDFGLPIRKGQYVGRSLYGRIGGGNVQIRLNSVNGGLAIKRKNDGRNPNPATNLLPAKNSGDNDWGADGNGQNFPAVKPPKVPRNPLPPLPPVFDGSNLDAEVQKEVTEALKAAQTEMGKLTPEIQKQIEESLKKANVDLNTKELREQIKLAQEKYKETMAQMSNAFWSPKIEKKSETLEVKGIPNIIIEAKSGAVSVRGWDKSEVRYSVTKISNTANQTPMNYSAAQNGREINIKISDSDEAMPFNRLNRVRVEVFVPKKSNLKIVANGEIRLEGVSGEIDLKGSDDAINVRDSDGKLQIVSDDGTVRVIGFRGEIDAKNGEGTLALEGDFQKFYAQTVDGDIILTLPGDANADIESNRKDIKSDGFSLKYVGDGKSVSTWKIGSGGTNYRLYSTADGQIFIRAANIVKTN